MRRGLTVNKIMKGASALVLALALVLGVNVFSLTSRAETGTLKADSAKIRSEASTSSDVMGGLKQGESFTIESSVSGADGYTWYKITSGTGVKGYVRGDLVNTSSSSSSSSSTSSSSSSSTGTVTQVTTPPTAVVTEVEPITGTVAGTPTRVRGDASTSSQTVTSLNKGTTVTVNGYATGEDKKTWYSIRANVNGVDVDGFIRSDLIKLSGELVDKAAEPEPVVEPEPEPVETTPEPVVEYKDYDTKLEGDTWYLLDYSEGNKYPIKQWIESASTVDQLKEWYNESYKTVKSQKKVIIILIIVVVILAGALTFLILKLKDMGDAEYYAALNRETARRKTLGGSSSGSKPQNSSARVVDHSVTGASKTGAAKPAAPKTGAATGSRPATGAPVANRPATGAPAGSRPVNGAAPAGSRPVNGAAPAGSRPATGAPGASRPVNGAAPAGTRPAAGPQPTGAQGNPTTPTTPAAPADGWKAKNFMDDEEDFEFEFLNFDGEE